MVIKKNLFILLLIFSVKLCFANEAQDGFLRLVLDEKTGGFSLYYLTDTKNRTYQPLFYSNDTSTSFISVLVDDVAYKPSVSKYFIKKIDTPHGQPTLVFESSFVLIRQIFSPVKTPNSDNINGVQITTTIHNKKNRVSFIGFRFVIDTSLGEERGRVPFITNNRTIRRETTIDGDSDELYWISRGRRASLMGSIANPINNNARKPDYLHFANWRRLYDADWNLEVKEKRSFSYLPYSVSDSAVSYYYLPQAVESGASLTFSIVLTTSDAEWYERIFASAQVPAASVPAAVPQAVQIPEIPEIQEVPDIPEVVQFEPEYIYDPEPEYLQETLEEYPYLNINELRELYALQETLINFIEGIIDLSEEDLLEIERNINMLKTGY